MKFLLLLLITMSCSTFKVPQTIDEIQDVAIEVTQPSVVVGPITEVVNVNVKSLTGFNEAQSVRFKKIAANVELIIGSEEFKQAILNHTWQGKKQFVDTKDTNEQVLEKILSKDWTLIYKLEYISKKPFVPLTVGYTYPDVEWIVINSKIFDTMDDSEIACNILHEYGGHKLGRYDHASKWSESRDYSAPYGIGYVGEKIYVAKFGK